MDTAEFKRVVWSKHRECSVLVVAQSQSFGKIWSAEWLVTAMDGPCNAAAGRCSQNFRSVGEALETAQHAAIVEIERRLAPALRALIPDDIC